ncbi:MAG: hypothetical protein HYW03_22220 [Deltaproteobacteria bacterium]|nr:hypothetical protein [Deltaproteobacteria bacterium]MBI2534907.1 hypothetical protein [Deltaproteobacteria bacterium]
MVTEHEGNKRALPRWVSLVPTGELARGSQGWLLWIRADHHERRAKANYLLPETEAAVKTKWVVRKKPTTTKMVVAPKQRLMPEMPPVIEAPVMERVAIFQVSTEASGDSPQATRMRG